VKDQVENEIVAIEDYVRRMETLADRSKDLCSPSSLSTTSSRRSRMPCSSAWPRITASTISCRRGRDGDPEAAIQSMHAQRQRPDSPLRVRDDVGTRELVLVMLAAAGPARTSLLETTRAHPRRSTRRAASRRSYRSRFSVLLPEAAGSAAGRLRGAYALLKTLSAESEKPFDEVWLLDATNGKRVRFGATRRSARRLCRAIAGALTYEPEMSGALPGIHPRGMHPTFSSFGYASLVFPRRAGVATRRSAFRRGAGAGRNCSPDDARRAQLAAKQFVAADEFALPLSRIGVDGRQALFRRFQPKTPVTERTRSARGDHRRRARASCRRSATRRICENLDDAARSRATDDPRSRRAARSAIDETLDRDGYDAAIALARGAARSAARAAPEGRARAAATWSRRSAPHGGARRGSCFHAEHSVERCRAPKRCASWSRSSRIRRSSPTRWRGGCRGREIGCARSGEGVAARNRCRSMIFAERAREQLARTAAREARRRARRRRPSPASRSLRELFGQLPRAEQALREALETRRRVAVAAAMVCHCRRGGDGRHRARIGGPTYVGDPARAGIFTVITGIRYATQIAPLVRDAKERLARLRALIETADQAKNAAHNVELQFEYDVMHRRTALRVLRASHDTARELVGAVRARREELELLAASFVPPSLSSAPLSLGVIDDEELDAWYARTIEDRKPFVREFPIRRAESRRLALEMMRERIASHAASAFTDLRKLTLAMAATRLADESKLAHRLKRFADLSAPLIELRDDDLQAQRSMQRDCTLWLDSGDAAWIAQLQRRFPESHVRTAPDALSVHVVTRVLHFPATFSGRSTTTASGTKRPRIASMPMSPI
jgi:hypothetical protein